MRTTLFLVLVCIFTTPYAAHAAELNAGFVQGLWYSEEKIFAEKPVRIYVAIRNNTDSDLTGTVEFFDGNKLIERNTISALSGRLIESWADWTPTYGEHTLSAVLKRVELHTVGTNTEMIEVSAALAEDLLFVDYDTDNDGVGNKDDADDDNDEIPDIEEIERGTDPLVFDASEEEEEEDEPSEAEVVEEPTSSPVTQSSEADSKGIEQFLDGGGTEQLFSQITNTINSTKKRLDSYRDERNSTREEQNIAHQSQNDDQTGGEGATFDEDGFGEVTRSEAEKETNLLTAIIASIGALLERSYTFILFLLSAYLAHPALVQVTLLALILFLIYKLARRMGRRPQ